MNNSIEVFVPGRLCIIGEHSDWAAGYRNVNKAFEKGYAIVAGLNLGIYLKGWKQNDFSYEYNDNKISLSCDELQDYSKKDFFEYVISSARIMQEKYNVAGAKIICENMTLPMKKGLASSAAICVAVIRIFNLLYDLKLSVETEMSLAYEAEIATGSMCGKMDQVCAYGQGIRKICFDGDKVEIVPIKMKKELFFVLVDLQGTKDTKKILSDLNAVYLTESHKGDGKLRRSLVEFNKRCVEESEQYLVNGDISNFAHVLKIFQDNFDENVACFSTELQAPKLHKLVDYCSSIEEVLACKGVGSQGDGMAQILLGCEIASEKIVSDIRNIFGMESYAIKVGQQCINAIIPIAGKGTRMYPFTHMVDKALLPVIDSGKVYPALSLILRELVYANSVGKVDLIVNEHQHKLVEELKLLLNAENINIPLNETLQIKKGFGGAIASSGFVNESGFTMVCLGDYIYRGEKYGDCTRQLVDFWKSNNKSVVGIKTIDINDTNTYGVVYGTWINENVLKIEKIVEKPDPIYAKNNLLLDYKGSKNVFAFFGEYIVDNDILRRMSLCGEENDIGFSEYLNEYAQRFPMYALVIQGESFDLGNPHDYYSSFIEYGKDNL